MISKVQKIAQEIGVKIKKCEEFEQIQMEKASERKTVEDKWKRKKYLQKYDSDTIKDVIKTRLHM